MTDPTTVATTGPTSVSTTGPTWLSSGPLVEAYQAFSANPINLLLQGLVIVLCVAVAVVLARRVKGTWLAHADGGHESRAAELARGLALRVVLPLTAAFLLLCATLALRSFTPTALVHLANVLLFAWGLIQAVVYVLRRSFNSALLTAFEKPFAWIVWLSVLLYLSGLHREAAEWLSATRLPLGPSGLSLLDLLQGVALVFVTVLAALWAGAFIEARLLRNPALDMSLRVVVSRIAKALLVFLAVLFALSAVGLDLTVLSVFGGALGVGLGFGLQKIASNYVSGFIILLERSLRIDDMVTINDLYYGKITQIRTRYTVVRALDGNEFIVPNELLIGAPVQNHSWSDRNLRVSQRLQISYSSNVEQALEILLEAVQIEPRVLTDPAPGAWLVNFGADGLDLEVAWFISDPENGTLVMRSNINRRILARFRAEGIEIPFPQRDLHVKSLPAVQIHPVAGIAGYTPARGEEQ